MCGIAGFIGAGNASDLRAMADAIIHRGPDGDGYFADQHLPVFLANRRLAVVDIAGGAQPMWDATGDICVIQNGEIYNHRALRRELEALGHRFTSDHSDTEVLVQGYKAWGEGLFVRLNGMFAVAIYDRHRKRLVLARDRFGEKPLFYGVSGATIDLSCSGSGDYARSLAHPSFGKRRAFSRPALMKFFAHGFFPGERIRPTSGIAKLQAGHVMSHRRRHPRTDTSAPIGALRSTPDAAPQGKRRRLDPGTGPTSASAKRSLLRLQADVPVGIFLSGGVDSSAVLEPCRGQPPPAEHQNVLDRLPRSAASTRSYHAEDMALKFGATHHLEICW